MNKFAGNVLSPREMLSEFHCLIGRQAYTNTFLTGRLTDITLLADRNTRTKKIQNQRMLFIIKHYHFFRQNHFVLLYHLPGHL